MNTIGTGTGTRREKYKGRHKGTFFVEKYEFIELLSIEPEFSLQGFKLLGISVEKLSSKRQPTVELVVDLWRSKTNENGFLVIGGPDVDNVQLELPNDNIMYRDKWNRNPKAKQLTLTNFLLNGWSDAKAIVLIYKKDERFEDFKLTERTTSITIDDKVLRIIQENLVDMVVYAEEASIERCNIFEIIQPRFKNINYMLREVDRGDRD